MDTLTMSNGSTGGVVSSNAGYSGTPLWKLKQQGALPRLDQRDEETAKAKEALAEEEEAANLLRVSVDAVSLGRNEGAGEKPLVRHIIVKDLRKVAARSRIALPAGGLFDGRAPAQLFAIFDGQSCAEAPGPFAAEWCSKQLLPKLLRNLAALPPGYENEVFVKATLTKTFEDLDKEILQGQPAIHDGCGAAVALTIGDRLFTAVTGRCHAVLGEAPAGANQGSAASQASAPPPVALPMGEAQGSCNLPEEQKFLTDNGGVVFQAENGSTYVSGPNGSVAAVSRSLGDRAWKGPTGGIPGSIKLLRSKPETKSVALSWADKHRMVVLGSAPVATAVTAKECIDIAHQLANRPRAASGELAMKAAEASAQPGQCTAVVVYFLPKEEKSSKEPAAKKARKEAESVRLRHILVKYRDCGQAFDPVRNIPVSRSREDAEKMLRRALLELTLEAKTIRAPAGKTAVAALQPTPKYTALCKELSECSTAQKGGGMMGDLGWQSPDQLARFGTQFAETTKALGVGQWSDLTASEHGVHILQRIA